MTLPAWLADFSYNDLALAIARSGMDISPCMRCGLKVVCIPDGLPCCEECAINEMEAVS